MWYKSYSDNYPVLVDKESSQKYVYLRKNVIEKEVELDKGHIITGYEYEECYISKDIYPLYEIETENRSRISAVEKDNLKIKADMTYMAMMSDIDLEEGEEENVEEV